MSCSRRLTALASIRPRFAVRTYTSTVPRLSENRMAANDPNPPVVKPSASTSNVPADTMSAWDGSLSEDPVVAERIRTMQAPNRSSTWAASQQPREEAMVGPRFEQTIMQTQVGATPDIP